MPSRAAGVDNVVLADAELQLEDVDVRRKVVGHVGRERARRIERYLKDKSEITLWTCGEIILYNIILRRSTISMVSKRPTSPTTGKGKWSLT